MKLLYITRKYPPMIGGMERMSYALSKEFKNHTDVKIISWGKSQKFLPIILPYFFLKAIYIVIRYKITNIHIGDGLLSPLGLLLKYIFKIKSSISIHGLDITYNFPGYQLIVPACIAKMDKIICISKSTLKECLNRGIPIEKCNIIPVGIYPNEFKIRTNKQELEELLHINLKNTKVILTVGRLVKRKGVMWFLQNVFLKLDKNIVYLIVGKGSEKNNIINFINQNNLKNRVFLLENISDQNLKIIYNNSNLFIMPNIKVNNNIEGFGIVAIEASSSGLFVIGSKIDGIADAVIENKTGNLVKSNNPKEYILAINKGFNKDKNEITKVTNKTYSWNNIGNLYMETIKL